jgi:hypothetical protein
MYLVFVFVKNVPVGKRGTVYINGCVDPFKMGTLILFLTL